LNGRIAVITGAGRGIGKGVALELAGNGFSVMLAARSEEQLRETAQQINGAGGRVAWLKCDVRNSLEVGQLFAACEQELGVPTVLVNNAGLGHFVATSLTTDQLWEETIAVNLTGAFYCCREAIPYFERAGGGLIINNASVAAVRSFPNFAAYTASKAGLLGLSRSLREELRVKNIRVSVVLPGATDTPFWDNVEGEWERARMLSGDHVARAIAAIALQPPGVQVEEITIMPAGGAL
jgi:NAD(P)-dependent dehydrogenase (short-subunit alcohol dehydrogenase family)